MRLPVASVPVTALVRSMPASLQSVVTGSNGEQAGLTYDQCRALSQGDLYIGFFNLSNQVPEEWMFYMKDDELLDVYVQQGRVGKRHRKTDHRLLVADTAQAHVMSLVERDPGTRIGGLQVAPISLRQSRSGFWSLSTDVVHFQTLAWVTHIAIATRKHGVIFSSALAEPIAVQPGNGVKYGLRISDVPLQRFPLAGDDALLLEAGHGDARVDRGDDVLDGECRGGDDVPGLPDRER